MQKRFCGDCMMETMHGMFPWVDGKVRRMREACKVCMDPVLKARRDIELAEIREREAKRVAEMEKKKEDEAAPKKSAVEKLKEKKAEKAAEDVMTSDDVSLQDD